MSRKTVLCDHCEASYSVQYDMDEQYFQLKYCPFCGDEQPEEDEYNMMGLKIQTLKALQHSLKKRMPLKMMTTIWLFFMSTKMIHQQ